MRTSFSFFVLLLLVIISCNNNSLNAESFEIPAMKSVEYPTYESQWKLVQEQEELGRPKSANDLVETIYEQAKAEENAPQIYKALVHLAKYTLTLEEDAELTVVNRLKEEIATADAPEQQILQSALAELYWQYFNANRWKFENRTATTGGIDESDFRTWDLNRLFEEASNYYQASIANEAEIQQFAIQDFDAILTNLYKEDSLLNDFQYLRPTLYDFLAHRAIQFYANDASGLTKPANAFVLRDAQAFAPADQFVNFTPNTTDTANHQLKALTIYQDIMRFHKAAGNEDAFLLANLDRLLYVYQIAKHNEKELLYEKALQTLLERNQGNAMAATAGFYLANLYYSQGAQYNANAEDIENETYQWKLKEAIAICEQMIETYPSSYGAKHCKLLKQRIEEPQINITTEEHLPTSTPFRFLLNSKNIDQLYFSIAKVNQTHLEKIEDAYRENLAKELSKLNSIAEWSSQAPSLGDYQNHSFEEIAQPETGLPNGQYIIIVSPEKQLTSNSEHFGWSTLQVTSIAYAVQHNQRGGESKIYVKNRTTGKPIPNAKITVSSPNNRNGNFRQQTYTANAQGVANINLPQRGYYNLELSIKANGEEALFNRFSVYNYREQEARWNNRALVFTDRSIYRPGQTVYFKALALETNGKESKILPNQQVTVEFRDVNGEEIEQLSLRTNEYGSLQGNFVIPRGRLLGNYQISLPGYGSTSISIEEYKRPRFQVEIDSLEGNYKLGDNIEATGSANSYAGATISNGTVTYRVTRTVRFPYWFGWYRPMPRGEEMEVAFGETTTDAQGNFTIPFTAIPDESIDADNLPVFDYRIIADVTDINGETRSAEQTVRVGYTALEINLQTKDEWQANNTEQVVITTQNLNQQPLSTQGQLAIYKLIAPDRVLGTRSWNAPDQQQITKQQWVKLFPHQPYNLSETEPAEWEVGKAVVEQSFATNENGAQTIQPNTTGWEPGWYKIVASAKDAFGKDIEQEQLIYLENENLFTVADNELLRVSVADNEYTPGQTSIVRVGTAASELDVLVQVFRDNELLQEELFTLQNEVQELVVPITEADRGGLLVKTMAIKWNELIETNQVISVPWNNKELSINASTFRDKLSPGGEETWSFTVQGDKAEAVNSELLVNMYDASLDQFKPHYWPTRVGWRKQSTYGKEFQSLAFQDGYFRFTNFGDRESVSAPHMNFAALNFFGLNLGYSGMRLYAVAERMEMRADGAVLDAAAPPPSPQAQKSIAGNSASDEAEESVDAEAEQNESRENQSLDIVPRTNLQETAFFFPQLTTDPNGAVTFSFTTPEALTEWKIMAFGHSKELQTGYWEGNTLTQKELMVTPNAPRFFREGDEITFSTKISNLTNKILTGQAELQLLNATNLQPVYAKFAQDSATKGFRVDEKGNTTVNWRLTIPEDVPAVTYRVLAASENFTDGEENALPVLSNRMLVTETLPIPLRSNETREFELEKLINNNSSSLKHHQLTLEMTSNPAWYAVQALPYLMEYPYQCAEQIFSRYYANSLATHIANSDPKIKAVFDTWRNYQPDALKSNLEKNEELKSLILRETPWVRDAQNEGEQKRRIGLLFDLNRMAQEQRTALNQLQQQQYGDGGWPWFTGGPSNRFISQHIVAGLGHLDALGVNEVRADKSTWAMTKQAIQFLDNQLTKDLNDLKRYNENWKEVKSLSQIHVHYFYTRSFFMDIPVSNQNQEAFDFYFNLLKTDWLAQQLYRDGLAAMALHRYNETDLAQQIVTSLQERSITDDELGMYWKSNTPSWWWYQAPIETQALMIEVFDEVANDEAAVDELKVWLLKNKQTNSWKTTKATSEAVYALLLRGGNWLAVDDLVELEIGGETVDPNSLDSVEVEAGTGYFKTSWSGNEIRNQMGEVKATKKGEGIAWGALYWQYFEDLDKITVFEDTPLKLQKQLFLQSNTASGPTISPVEEGQSLAVGDLLKVRIELRVDRKMEFVHMKDMRAAGFEPTNVISQYKWQDGLGYYESTKDASTDFFFDVLPKGVYVFEYPLRVNNAGEFSNGITTIQSMYAPEFTSHSEGVRVVVK